MPRAFSRRAVVAAAAAFVALPAAASGDFARFVADLWPDAQKAGVSRATFDGAFRGVAPDAKVAALTRKQSEFVRPIADYVSGAVSPDRLAKAAALRSRWASPLEKAERDTGVPPHVVLALWGMESGFGANTGGFSVVRSLATLAHLGHRAPLFRDELIAALVILEEGHIERADMLGSWAGAMGQTQFMPSSFLAYAVDGDGDRRKDIWTSAPDAIASTANYLKGKGWVRGVPAVLEVGYKGGADPTGRLSFAAWKARGIERLDGRPMPSSGEAALFFPTGVKGPAFLLSDNFDVIRAYNSSDAYALAVGWLANRIGGAGPLKRPWPPASELLNQSEREEVQRRLAERGLYEGEADGRHGRVTREAIRRFQASKGLTPDGYADRVVLTALRGSR